MTCSSIFSMHVRPLQQLISGCLMLCLCTGHRLTLILSTASTTSGKHGDDFKQKEKLFPYGGCVPASIIHDPDKDGSCQFSAVSYELFSVLQFRVSPSDLRYKTVQFLRANETWAKPFVHDISWDSYLSQMTRFSTYGDHLTLLAMAKTMKIQMLVLSNKGLNHTRIISDTDREILNAEQPLIVLGHYAEDSGTHYVAIDASIFNAEVTQNLLKQMHGCKHNSVTGSAGSQMSNINADAAAFVNDESQELQYVSVEEDNELTSKALEQVNVAASCCDLGVEKPAQPVLSEYPGNVLGKRLRRFCSSWFNRRNWLEYSVQKDAAFCYACRRFQQYISHSSDQTFITIGYRKWNHALEQGKGLFQHESSSSHKQAMIQWNECIRREKSGETIAKRVFCDVVERNRYYVRGIVEVVQFLARNGLAFRGNMSACQGFDENLLPHQIESGLFNQLFEFALQKDSKLQEIAKSIPANAQYTSPKMQNEIIHEMAKYTVQIIVDAAKELPFFSVLADETRDKQNVEDLAIAIRYVTRNASNSLCVNERCISIVDLSDQTANTIATEIVSNLTKAGMHCNRIISQSYDGAAVMSGISGGVQKLLSNTIGRAIPYIHCYSHQLHLVVMQIVKENSCIANFFDICEQLYQFFRLQPVVHLYEGHTLKRLLPQRWSGHADTIEVIAVQTESIIHTLDDVIRNENQKRNLASLQTEAIGLKVQLLKRKFTFLLHFLRKVLGIIKPLSTQLQSRTANISAVTHLVTTLLDELREMRNSEAEFHKFLESCKDCDKLGNTSTPNESQSKRTRRPNAQMGDFVMDTAYQFESDTRIENSNSDEAMLKQLYLSVLDTCVTEITRRFSVNNLEIVAAIGELQVKTRDLQKLKPLIDIVAPVVDQQLLSNLDVELKFADRLIGSCDSLEEFSSKLDVYKVALPGLSLLLQAALSVPCSTAVVESCFSSLTRILRPQRLSMKHDRKASLVLLEYNKDLVAKLDLDELVLRIASSAKNRRLTM